MQCITGVGVAHPKKFKKATSNTYFSAMAKIPDERIVSLLTSVVQGRMSLAEFHAECKLYKVEMHVRKLVLEHMKIETWAEGHARYPRVFDDEWVCQWVRTFEHLRKSARKKEASSSSKSVAVNDKGIPIKFIEEIEEKRLQKQKVRVPSCLLVLLYVWMSFIRSIYDVCSSAFFRLIHVHKCV